MIEHYAEIAVSLPWSEKVQNIPDAERDAAFGFYTAACCYCQDNLTDGRIKTLELPKVFPTKRFKKHAQALLAARLFDETDEGYYVHDYLHYNKSAEEILALTNTRRNAGRKGGQASAQARAQAKSNPAFSSQLIAKERPKPSCPKTAKPAVLDGFEEWWKAYPRKEGKGAARTAYTKALGKTDAASLLAALTRSARSWEAEKRERRLIPQPATWLNQERWEDDYSASVSSEDAYLQAKYGGTQ